MIWLAGDLRVPIRRSAKFFLRFHAPKTHLAALNLLKAMIRRIPVLLLSLCIGLPVCWCPVSQGAGDRQQECCAAEHSQERDGCGESEPGDPSCPCCSLHKEKRAISEGLAVPKPGVRVLPFWIGWEDARGELNRDFARASDPALREHGPPGLPSRLYLRQRALLL